jgi:riboflavin synthase
LAQGEAPDLCEDTVRDALDERLGPLMPALEALLKAQGSSVDELARPLLPRQG